MPEPVQTQEPVAQQNTQAEPAKDQNQPQEKQEDILSRVSKVKAEPQPELTDQQTGFDPKDIDKITDPAAKEYAQKAYKELERGYQKKFRELAEKRKEVEQQLSSSDFGTRNFTHQEIQEMIKNPSFNQAAQQLTMQTQQQNNSNGQLSDDEWSALTTEERQQFMQMQQGMNSLHQELNSMRTQQEDARLQDKYANYDPQRINQLQQDLLSGRLQATREHLHRVVDYEDAVKRAYQLGKEDRKLDMGEKAQAITSNGANNMTPSNELPARDPKQSPIERFKQIALFRQKQAKERSMQN